MPLEMAVANLAVEIKVLLPVRGVGAMGGTVRVLSPVPAEKT